MFKMLNGYENINRNMPLSVMEGRTRGHGVILYSVYLRSVAEQRQMLLIRYNVQATMQIWLYPSNTPTVKLTQEMCTA